MFEDILAEHKDANGYSLDTDLTAEDWKELVSRYKARVARRAASRSRRTRASSFGVRSVRCSVPG